MARGKIYTNRKKAVQLGNEKKKQPSKAKKDKKAQQKQEKKPIATDVFDYRTGVVYSIRPEDTDVQLMEAKVTSYLKEKGAIEDPKDHLTTAIYIGGPNLQTIATDTNNGESVTTSAEPLTPSAEPVPSGKVTMENSEVPVTFWHELKDTKTNSSYYWNPETNQTSWTLPENAVITCEASERSDKITDPDNEEDNSANDLVKAYTELSKTFLGNETGESNVSIGIVSSIDNETPVNVTPTNKKTKKGKKQKPGDVNSTKNSPAFAKAESPVLKLQVSNLSDEISRKLEYLHVSRERISELQKLQIQLDTRMEDWKEEQLSSKYFLIKLKSASDQVNESVEEELPTGWSCAWDRASCRYYFNNASSGEISWEFPVANPDSVCSSHIPSEEEERENEEEEEKGSDDDGENDDVTNNTTKATVSPDPQLNPPTVNDSCIPVTIAAPEPLCSNQTTPSITMVESMTTTPQVNSFNNTFVPAMVVTDQTVVVEEADIAEVEMDEQPDDNDIDKMADKPESIPDTNKLDFSKADTPPMQLYDDIGPITIQKCDTDTTVEYGQDEQHEETSQTVEELKESVDTPLPLSNDVPLPLSNDVPLPLSNDTPLPLSNDVPLPLSNDVPLPLSNDVEAEDGEVVNSDDDRNQETNASSKKQRKRSKYHSDSDDSYDGRRKSSSSKRSRRHRDDSDHSDDYYSKSSRSRRSHSRDRGYYDRSDSEERHYKKSRSSRGKYTSRDDSDNEQFSSSRRSSRKQRSRSGSRDHGSRELPYVRKDSKKKKKEKRKHKHRDSSSGEEYYNRKQSKSKGSREKDYDFSGNKTTRDSQVKDQQPPPFEKKAFVPAKFKPKVKSRDNMDDNGISNTQLEIMKNIASVTGAGYMMPITYPLPHQYNIESMNPQQLPVPAMVPQQLPVPAMNPQQLPVPAMVPQPPVMMSESDPTTSGLEITPIPNPAPSVSTPIPDPAPSVSTPIPNPAPSVSTPIPDPAPSICIPVDDPVPPVSTPIADPAPPFSIEPTPPVPETTPVIIPPPEPSPIIPSDSNDEQSKPVGELINTVSDTVSTQQPPQPVATAELQSSPVTQIDPTTSVAIVTETNNMEEVDSSKPTEIDTTVTMESQPINTDPAVSNPAPTQDVTSQSYAPATISASSTNYSSTPTTYGYDPSQQAAYAVYAQQYYGNPYQYYTDPTQYAAAMNYYAAYQAAYTGTYSAYYQQGGQNPPGSTGESAQK